MEIAQSELARRKKLLAEVEGFPVQAQEANGDANPGDKVVSARKVKAIVRKQNQLLRGTLNLRVVEIRRVVLRHTSMKLIRP
jgi:hypothetical protein